MRGDAGSSSFAHSARHRATAPTRLGLTLRSVAIAPRDGFAAAIRTGERRARAGERPAEGFAPYVLGAIGGVAAMSLWLKLGALVGRGDGPVGLALVASALVLGALVSVAAQSLWGRIACSAASALGGEARSRDLRLAWGGAGLPQTLVVLVLLPLDLLIAGSGVFSSGPLADSVTRGWAALSLASAATLAVWSLWLFVRGVEVSSGLGLRRAVLLAAVAAGCLGGVVGALALLARALV